MDLNPATFAKFSRLGVTQWRTLHRRVTGRDVVTGTVGSYVDYVRDWLSRSRWFAWTVLAPTLCVAIYYLVFAADQYVSEAQFMVRGTQDRSTSLLGEMLGGSGLSTASEETSGVAAYLVSHDASNALQKKLDIVSMLRRSGFDFRNWIGAHPSPESLLRYYRHHVSVSTNSNTGIVTLQVRAYRPEDARLMDEALLEQSEQLVNRFSARAEEDALRVANDQIQQTEARLETINQEMTHFRTTKQAIDPTRSSALTQQEITDFDAQLGIENEKLAEMKAVLKPDAQALRQQQERVNSLQDTLTSRQSNLVGGDGSMAPVLGDYERLVLQQQLADKDYAAAVSALQTARLDAQRQHLYLVRVVEPNLPQKSLYPNRGLIILTVFISLCVAYGIGWLIVAGVREHAA
jgi:capsular polysaccharide transport system permease protein